MSPTFRAPKFIRPLLLCLFIALLLAFVSAPTRLLATWLTSKSTVNSLVTTNSPVVEGTPIVIHLNVEDDDVAYVDISFGGYGEGTIHEELDKPFVHIAEAPGPVEATIGFYNVEGVLIDMTSVLIMVSPAPTSEFQSAKRNSDIGGMYVCVCPEDDDGMDGLLDPVFLHSGEFFITEIDLRIPGRGFDYEFRRTYKNQIQFDGRLGNNWQHGYDQQLIQNGTNINLLNGDARVDTYTSADGINFTSPAGFYTSLTRNNDGSYSLRNGSGSEATYFGFDGSAAQGKLSQIRDRQGNQMLFIYDDFGRLIEVVDTLGRSIRYVYNENNRLAYIEDFIGRRVTFTYDGNNDLVVVTGPPVTGTPNGNDFPNGKSWQYSYSSGFANEQLNHNLLTVVAPNEVADGSLTPYLINTYNETAGYQFDRLISQVWGGTNGTAVPAGGTLTISYEALNTGADPANLSVPRNRTTVTDRNGNIEIYEHNSNGHRLTLQEASNRNVRPGDPTLWQTTYFHNADGELAHITYPEGNSVSYVYDEASTNRLAQGNLTAVVHTPDLDRGGDQKSIITRTRYEPIYNQVKEAIEPRGNDLDYVPQNGGAWEPDRYTTFFTYDYEEGCDFAAIGAQVGLTAVSVQQRLQSAEICLAPLGDVNGDGVTNQVAGNVIRIDHPTVTLLPDAELIASAGDDQQHIVELFTYNSFGQLVREVDPEGNIDTYEYYSEQDPNGDGAIDFPNGDPTTGGYLHLLTTDAGPTTAFSNIRQQYAYDAVGNVVQEIDGRGIATNYVVNALNQVVQVEHAAAHDLLVPKQAEPLPLVDFGYIERFFYDANNNLILHQVEDRGNTSRVDGNLPAALASPFVGDPDPSGGTAYVDTVYQYDILDNLLTTISEVANGETAQFLTTHYRYDPNQNEVLILQPEGNGVTAVFDERDLLFQQINGAISPPALTLLAPSDPTHYDVRGGEAATTTFHYDSNQNLIESVDATDSDGSDANNSDIAGTGDRTRYIYDGFDRLTSVVDSVGNQSVNQYDPADNIIRTLSFGPVGGVPPLDDGPDALAQPVSDEGVIMADHLVTDNLLAASQYHFDELNRLIQADELLFVTTIGTQRPPNIADGAVDLGKGSLTPDAVNDIPGLEGHDFIGDISSRSEYDRNSRLVYQHEDDGDMSQIIYDGADRPIRQIDAEGNIVETAYDDNHNVIEVQETDVAQDDLVPDELFITTYFYDSLDRLQQQVDNVGQSTSYRYDSRHNLVTTADAQGPLTGNRISRRAFSGGLKTVNFINDFGNVTRYAYDGLSRQLSETLILTSSGAGDGGRVGASIFGVKDDPTAFESGTPTPDTTQSGNGRIDITYSYDDNSLLTTLTDDNGNQTAYSYDNLNRTTRETKGICVTPQLADQCDAPTTIFYSYDRDSNLTTLTDENGSVVTYQYDGVNRRQSETVNRAPNIVGTTERTYEYDGLYRLVRATDNNEPGDADDDSIISYAYDSVSRVIEETQQIGLLPARAVSTGWRAENLRGELIYPNGRLLTYSYDNLDRTEAIYEASSQDPLTHYRYIGPYRVLERSYPLNGTRMSYLDDSRTVDVGYDGLRRPIQLRHLREGDNSLLVGFAHSYDRMNNKLTEDKLHDPANSEVYAYDSAYRLIHFSRPHPDAIQPLHSEWVLDGVGNWSQVDDETRQHSSFNELIEQNDDGTVTSLGYDDNGNTTDDGRFLYTWDYRNRLRTATQRDTGELTAVYAYDAADRRISKLVFDTTQADVVVSKVVDKTAVRGGEEVVYTLTVSNLGDATATNIRLTDPLDGNLSFVSASNGGMVANGSVTWQIDSLAPNQSNSYTLVVRTANLTSMTLVENTATIETADSQSHSATATITIIPPHLLYLPIIPYNTNPLTNNKSPNLPISQSPSLQSPISRSPSTKTYFYYNGWQVLEERNLNDQLTQQYVYGATYIDELILFDRNLNANNTATDPSDQRLFYHQNTLYSVFALTDSTGTVVETYTYDVYGLHEINTPLPNESANQMRKGNPLFGSATGNPYFFTSRRLDPETETHHFRNRQYSATSGRFLQRDWACAPSNLGNLYTYVGNKPVGQVDPLGLFSSEDFGKVIGGAYDAICYIGEGILNTGKELVHQVYRLQVRHFAYQKKHGIFKGAYNSHLHTAHDTTQAAYQFVTELPGNLNKARKSAGRNLGKGIGEICYGSDLRGGTKQFLIGVAETGSLAGGGVLIKRIGQTLARPKPTTSPSPIDSTPASTPVGHRGKSKLIYVPKGTNPPAIIRGREYTGYALDRMQRRGLVPTVIESTIQNGKKTLGNKLGRFVYTTEEVKVVTTSSGKVITVYQRGSSKK